MSYQVLARKWRPANFQELVGQEHVQRALVNALNDDRLHHAYLFTGTRGVGKTTIARIFSKSLNCETGITSTPCGVCSTCMEIAEGRYVDLIEVDAASRTGVDDTRDLLENVQYAPTRGRYKVYLIDEVHMFSKSSFNALLKTLEEPPPHVKFLLATTDPQKLPVTILSRCLQFNLKRLPVSLIISHLQHILTQEQVEFNVTALQLIAEGADGSMRDALSLLDQALAFGGGTIREQEVRDMLGTVSREKVLDLLAALLSRDAESCLQEVAVLAEFSPDYESVLAELISVLHHMNLAKVVPQALDEFVSARERLLQLSQQVSVEDLQLFYQIGLIGRRDLPLSPDARSGFEMILLRMLAFRPVNASDLKAPAPGHVPSAPESSPGSSSEPLPAASPGASQRRMQTDNAVTPDFGTGTGTGIESEAEAADVPAAEAGRNAALAAIAAINNPSKKNIVSETSAKPLTEPAVTTPPQSHTRQVVAHEVRESTPPETGFSLPEEADTGVAGADKNVPRATAQSKQQVSNISSNEWRDIVQALSLGGLVKQLAVNCVFKQRDGDSIVLLLEQGHSNLLNPKAKLRLQQALGEYFDIEAQLGIEVFKQESEQQPVQGKVAETPAQTTQREQRQRQQQSEQSMNEDSFVQTLRENFNAEIIPGSVKPVS